MLPCRHKKIEQLKTEPYIQSINEVGYKAHFCNQENSIWRCIMMGWWRLGKKAEVQRGAEG